MDLSEKRAWCHFCGEKKWTDNEKRNRHIIREHPHVIPDGVDLSDY